MWSVGNQPEHLTACAGTEGPGGVVSARALVVWLVRQLQPLVEPQPSQT